MRFIYLDSVILIYHIDHAGSIQTRAVERLTALEAAGDRTAVSELVRYECRVLPIRLADAEKLAVFDAFFARPDVTNIPITTAVFERATDIRARHGFKSMDALHLAAAVEGGCDAFLTNDLHLARFPDIAVEALP